MRRIHPIALLQRCVEREYEYHNIKICTNICQLRGLTYGVSFYGASFNPDTQLTKYKRIEIWCKSCPTPQEFKMLKSFFSRNVPVCNNSIFAFINGDLFEVKP